MVVRGWMMILEGPSLCITENKTKGKVEFENCRLISKNAVQLFVESIPANLRRSKIWRLSILHYTPPPPPPNVNSTNTPTPPPLCQQIALGHYMTSYMTYMGSKCAFIIVIHSKYFPDSDWLKAHA